MPEASLLNLELVNLELACFIIAVLYSITGHAGASGYIAVMALLGMAPQEIKPLALALNVVVSLVATVQFYRAGHFDRKLFFPFVLGSMPLALLGGYVQLPMQWFKWLMGAALIVAAVRVVVKQPPITTQPVFSVAASLGAVIGLISGLIGVGGGIFLTPLLLLMGWANAKQAAAVSAPFILLNSLAALVGLNAYATQWLPDNILYLVLAVLMGGLLGSFIGSRIFSQQGITRVLSAVLLIAGAKLLYV